MCVMLLWSHGCCLPGVRDSACCRGSTEDWLLHFPHAVNMSGSITGGTEDCSSWTVRQKEEFSAWYREQKVLLDEISNLKKDRRVYKQQRNSNIYFLADKSKTLSECKKTLDDMKPTYQTLENAEKTEAEN